MSNANTFRQSLARVLRGAADYYDPPSCPPTISEIADRELYNAEVALLKACEEMERAKHTVAMLEERVGRLRGAATIAPP